MQSEKGTPAEHLTTQSETRPPDSVHMGEAKHSAEQSAASLEATFRRMANELFNAPPGTVPTKPGGSVAPLGSGSSSRFADFEAERLKAKQASRPVATQSLITSLATTNTPFSGELLSAPMGSGAIPTTAVDETSFYFLKECTLAVDPAVRGDAASGVGGGSSLHRRPFDVNAVRRDFPILQERVNGGRPLVWFDNAATTHKPQVVIQRLVHYYTHENSNIHRAAHELAARSTDAYEASRETVARFLNAPSSKGIIFTRGATEAINLVAQSWGRQNVGEGDEILITHLEHHANIVPWQRLAAETGAVLRVAPVDDRGEVIQSEYLKLLSRKTRLVAFPQVSNALGTITPAQQMIEMAHRVGAVTLLDGAQSVPHMRQNVALLDTDFFVFSGHKVFAPTGIGVLYGKADLLDSMQPWQGGGNMIEDVTFERTTYQAAPARFEAGTGSIANAVGLGVALEYLETIGIENISRYEHDLLEYGTAELLSVQDLRLIGTAAEKASVLSFVIDGLRTEDIGKALSDEGIAVRAGHHCAQPILRRFGLESTVRASLALYNTFAEIDVLVSALRRIRARGSVMRN